jgi:apolipoprotein N-acyltransferase
MLSIITNDAWYDHTVGPRQHYLIACARAIENHRYIVRVANTGVSGLISPLGKSLFEIEQYTQEALHFRVPLMKNDTIYAKFGDWLPILSFIIVITLLIFIYVKKNK